MAKSSRHWYVKSQTGDIEESYGLGIRDARKLKAFISPTSLMQEVRATPFQLVRWQRKQLAVACINNPKIASETEDEYYERVNSLSYSISESAANFGSSIHDMAEKYPARPPSSILMPWYHEFVSWHDSHIAQDWANEMKVLDSDLGVAGKLDRLVVLKEGNSHAVVDFKTQSIKDRVYYGESWPKQLSFYANAVRKMKSLHENPVCLSVIIDSNSPSKFITKRWSTEEINEAYVDFIIETWLWSKDNSHWPVGRWDLGYTLHNKHICPG
jgi:hypothetical protein